MATADASQVKCWVLEARFERRGRGAFCTESGGRFVEAKVPFRGIGQEPSKDAIS